VRLHLVDGTFELYRAHYGHRPEHTTPDGRAVKATVGLVWSMLALLHDVEESVSHVAIAFDNPIRSFRNDLWPGYKSDEGVPPELRAQFDLAEDAMRALGLVVWSMHEHEADDALATAALRHTDEVEQVRILTPDKDLGQCVRGTRIVQVDRIHHREIDEIAVTRARVAPACIPDYLALVGDAADGIPGVPGFGAKSVSALLGCFGALEAIPADPGLWPAVRGAPRLAAELARARDDATLFKRLATLVVDVPLAETLDDLRWAGVPRVDFHRWCADVGAEGLAFRPVRWRQ